MMPIAPRANAVLLFAALGLGLGCKGKDLPLDTGTGEDGGEGGGSGGGDSSAVWDDLRLESSVTLTGGFASGAGFYATAEDGEVYVRSEGEWSAQGVDSEEPLNGIWGVRTGEVNYAVAVGDGGTVARLDEFGWLVSQELNTANMESVDSADGEMHVSVGWGGAYVSTGPATWEFQTMDGNPQFNSVWTDGSTTVALSPAQDFKRIFDNDEGPNTGGMGAYTPLDWAPEGLVDEVIERIAQPTVNQMAHRGTPFVGVLFVGLALTSRGTRVIEFNVRFGDPETQAVLARLRTPLGGLLMAAAKGELDKVQPLRWSKESAVAVVVAAENYPGTPRTGDRIRGLKKVEAIEGVHVIHAGTKLDDEGKVVSAGGRVLAVVALGTDLVEARERAYDGVELVQLDGGQFRTDIGGKAARGEIKVTAPGTASAAAAAAAAKAKA